MNRSASRYQDKPLLRLLELYVLWGIDHLPENEATTLEEMTPKLQTIYQAQGDWQNVISTALDLPENLPALIKECWANNSEIARKNNQILHPQQFAEIFVDQNFPN